VLTHHINDVSTFLNGLNRAGVEAGQAQRGGINRSKP
jgi:hypothetical protein